MSNKNMFNFGVRELKLYEITAPDTETALPQYGKELPVGSTNAVKLNYDTANAKAYGDDAVVADISAVTGASLEWAGWDAPQATKAHIYGHRYEDGVLHESTSDAAPYIGASYIRTLRNDASGMVYEAVAVYKAQAVKGNEDNATKSNNLNLGTTPITMNVVETLNGCLLDRQQFVSDGSTDALSAARQWLAGIFKPAGETA